MIDLIIFQFVESIDAPEIEPPIILAEPYIFDPLEDQALINRIVNPLYSFDYLDEQELLMAVSQEVQDALDKKKAEQQAREQEAAQAAARAREIQQQDARSNNVQRKGSQERVGAAERPTTVAVPQDLWNKWLPIARCESGYGGEPNWSINTGNGYYGGLQFDLPSWEWAGGHKYTRYPHHATPEQQILIAEKLLAMHPAGWGAWPACSRKVGYR